jgi:rSAM/selenodomain-associated transferase 1
VAGVTTDIGLGRLYIAARAPRPGQVKTRLARTIGDAAAARLYTAFLRDLGARFGAASFPLGWYVTPDDAWGEIAALLEPRPGTMVRVQPAGDWAERQRHLLRQAAAQGERPVVLIASDSPQLAEDMIAGAFELLRDQDLVLGPTHDGGYSLIGMRGWHDVLQGVVMSRSDVVPQICRRARALGLRTAMLEPTFDVDEASDLHLLEQALSHRSDLGATRAALYQLGLANHG